MKDLTKGKPSTLILSFALPVFLGNLLQLTYSLADTRIVGSFLKEDALAAVGATSPLSGLIIGFLMGLANGFAIVTAQKFGAGNREEVRKSFALSLVMGSVISLILTVLGLLFLHPILRFLNVPDHLTGTARQYIFIIIAGMLATFLYDTCAASLRALGDTVTPLVILAVSVTLNIAGDLFFILVVKAGVQGAAVATVLSQTLAFLICWFYMIRRYEILRLKKEDFFGLERNMMKNMLSAVGKHDIELHCRQFNESKFSDILLIDDFETDYSLNQLKKFEEEYNTVIYLNSKKMFTMYDEIDRSRFLEMYPWQINITKYVESDNGLEDTEDIVWMKSSEERWICMTETFEMSKKLKNMGAVLNAKTPQEHELEIKRLKGLLEATERRLLDYIQREKELTEEIQRLKNGEEE